MPGFNHRRQFFTERRRSALDHEYYMEQALLLAREAARAGEVPVGCVIVRGGEIVGRGRNRREEKQATCSHAEMEAIREANRALGSWRLEDCTLYVTLEPCPMCAGAIVLARIPLVVWGMSDPLRGGAVSRFQILQSAELNHRSEVLTGVLEAECAAIIKEFFRKRRLKGKNSGDFA